MKRLFLTLCMVFLVSSIFSSFAFADETSDEKLNVVALGDSITYGWKLDDRSKAFPYLIGIGDNNVTNVSFPGWTSTQLLQTVAMTPEVDFALQQADVVTLNIGGNDLLQATGIGELIKNGQPATPTAEMQQKVQDAALTLAQNINAIIAEVHEQTDAPVVLYNMYNPFGPSENPTINSYHVVGQQIMGMVNNMVYAPISVDTGSVLADAFTAFDGKQAEYILPMDVHPNVLGHQVLADVANEALDGYNPVPETGWVTWDGHTYYLDENGDPVTGWYQVEGKWYLFSTEGIMQTGWKKWNNKWYFLEKSGVMKTGWVLDKGKWYFLEKAGAMKTGWILDKGKWYFLDVKSGAMKTGWVLDKGKWYFLDLKSGAMKTGWLLDKGKWYLLGKDGAMKTGWQLVNGKWYYLYKDGSMAYSTTIQGYKLGKDGAWIK
ncbi:MULTISPECIES: GDSL-type esterase/lipase family protein [unclassified Bacillus (in: firmicutes)]|uniref:GDSL-type esterase/lipase family protein n=1 Tax=unclassified Bacillus (in: firmicutes) TaxID=185979 RepID=UPI0008DFC872|nr:MULTISPECIES: GDSL-type esterase/lipase family protein [unclassified Bacillus (in: firmicutes)]SFB20831.1 Putative cell wall binding repeat-containing protein [Bacillus sp. UNCCL13]SFQ90913.1 Putative cell wall binding repeat-containing protein [Bacillus sp. cl95]